MCPPRYMEENQFVLDHVQITRNYNKYVDSAISKNHRREPSFRKKRTCNLCGFLKGGPVIDVNEAFDVA